jgi:hypothetical protein
LPLVVIELDRCRGSLVGHVHLVRDIKHVISILEQTKSPNIPPTLHTQSGNRPLSRIPTPTSKIDRLIAF